jgi:hypothetical protein
MHGQTAASGFSQLRLPIKRARFLEEKREAPTTRPPTFRLVNQPYTHTHNTKTAGPTDLEGEDAVVVAADDAEARDGQGLGGVALRQDERAVRGAGRACVCGGGKGVNGWIGWAVRGFGVGVWCVVGRLEWTCLYRIEMMNRGWVGNDARTGEVGVVEFGDAQDLAPLAPALLLQLLVPGWFVSG